MHVQDLHGHRTYDVEAPLASDGADTSRLILLHGENGSGKTTLLRLVWHALSSADNRGHRTHLARTPFSTLSIDFTDGRTLLFDKVSGLTGDFTVSLNSKSKQEWAVYYSVDEDMRVSRRSRALWSERISQQDNGIKYRHVYPHSPQLEMDLGDDVNTKIIKWSDATNIKNENRYYQFLENYVETPLFLADDRILYSDDPLHNRTREMLSRRSDRSDRLDSHLPTSHQVSLELRITMRRVNDVLRSLTIGGQTDGSANRNTIYADVLRQLVQSPLTRAGATPLIESASISVYAQLDEIADAAPSFERYGLSPRLDVPVFRSLLQDADAAGIGDTARSIVEPFLSSIRAQQHALRQSQQLLESLIPTINDFLQNKTLSFAPQSGLGIHATHDDNALEPEDLSSGERQLLMVLFTTLLARFDTRLFIIDEPELSMGVPWQRRLIDALITLTHDSPVQFLIATHSIEIISSHVDALVQLKDRNKG